MSVRRVRLEEVCDRITVGHVGPMATKYIPEGVPFLRSQNIQPFKLALNEVKYISAEFHHKLRKSALRAGDVAIIRTGFPGTACVIPASLPVANCADLVVITPGPSLNPYYLAAIFNSAYGRASVAGNLVGVAQQHFNVGAAREMVIDLPCRCAQDKVVGILSAYDDLIENCQRRIRILEEMARRLYREWFVHFRYPGHESIPLKESPLGPIPQGWEVKDLREVACVNRKQINAKTAPAELHYIDIASVSPGKIDEITAYAFDDAPGRARRIVQHGDVIWSTVRPNRRSYALVLDPIEDTIASTGFAVLTARAVPFAYLYLATTTDEFVSYLTNHATGAAYPAVTGTTFECAPLLVPSSLILEHFSAAATPMFEESHVLLRQTTNLRRTRDLLLPRLLGGR